MTIGQLEKHTGVAASTIRYWERIRVLAKPPRVSGQRRYSPDAVHSIAVLRLAQACGFSLDEMRHLLHGFTPDVPASDRWQELAQEKAQELDRQMASLEAMRQLVARVGKCECEKLAECGRKAGSVMERTRNALIPAPAAAGLKGRKPGRQAVQQ